ncbi:tetratricopeptide repeat protein [Streptomyces sp. NPDC093260]|uniref:tetratricopeptide repeat protein n=1 Tax=Streptomyces sp. NPDC093260 TaxID=3155073 RepID=UPI00344349DA
MGSDRNEISGGVFFGPVVQARSIENLVLPTPAVTAMASLPPAPEAFVGRTHLLRELLEAVRPQKAPPRPPGRLRTSAGWEWRRRVRAWSDGRTVVLLTGPPGVGKTALALLVCQETERRGWYRHQLYLDLRSHENASFRPDVSGALGALLRALGVSADSIGHTMQERAAQYRSRMRELAQQGHPVLLVLDNAASREQVEALLPPHPRNCTLVVGRRRLSGGGLTGARQHDVPVFSAEESVTFLQLALSRSRPGDERATDVAELRSLAGLCGRFALALALVAAELVSHPHMSPAALVARLRTAAGLLDLGSESEPGAGAPAGSGPGPVRAALALSYDRLTPEQARLFRLGALHPGTSFHTEQAAALVGGTTDETAERLRALATAGLLAESSRQDDRYQYHDLLREYARERTEQQDSDADRREAARRLIQHYALTARRADAALRGTCGPDTRFTDRVSARRWFDIEHPALVGAVQLGAASGLPAETAALAVGLTAYFDLRKRWDEWRTTHELAADCARQAGDRAREGLLLGHLGRVHAQQRRYDQALLAYGRSRAAYRAAGDVRGAHLVLGRMLRVLQDTRAQGVPLQEAIRRYESAAGGLSEADDPETLANILNNLGNLQFAESSYAEAAKCHERALRIRVGRGDRRGAAQSLVNLGNALRAGNASQQAVEPYEHAAQTFREIDDRYSQAQALENLGLAHLDSGNVRACRHAWRDAAACFTEAGHPTEAARVTGSIWSLSRWRRKQALPGLLRRAGTNYHVPREGGDSPTGTDPLHGDRVRVGGDLGSGTTPISSVDGAPSGDASAAQADGQRTGDPEPGPEPGAAETTHEAHVIDALGGGAHEVAHEGGEVTHEGGEEVAHDDPHGEGGDEHIDVDHTPPVDDFGDEQYGDPDGDMGNEHEPEWDDD